MPGPLLAAAISAGIPAVASFLGGERANRANAQEAARNREFQERMSSTAYQRATADMRAAGINPMLAFMQGGASAPGGAQANLSDTVGPAVSSAQHGRRLHQELELMQKDYDLRKLVATQQAANLYTDTLTKGLTHDQVRAQTQETLARVAESIARAENLGADTRLLQQNLKGELLEFGRQTSGAGRLLYWGERAASALPGGLIGGLMSRFLGPSPQRSQGSPRYGFNHGYAMAGSRR